MQKNPQRAPLVITLFALAAAIISCGVGAGGTSVTDGTSSEVGTPDLGAGADMKGYPPFPDDNAWNTPIDTEPVDPNSAILISTIGADRTLHPDFGANWNGGPF